MSADGKVKWAPSDALEVLKAVKDAFPGESLFARVRRDGGEDLKEEIDVTELGAVEFVEKLQGLGVSVTKTTYEVTFLGASRAQRGKGFITLGASVEHAYQFFVFAHLPENLQEISRPFAELAEKLLSLPRNRQREIALEKLLEAKNAAVCARISK